MPLSREQLAARVGLEISDGAYVNLGIGLPTLVANHLPAGLNVVLTKRERHSGGRPVPNRRF